MPRSNRIPKLFLAALAFAMPAAAVSARAQSAPASPSFPSPAAQTGEVTAPQPSFPFQMPLRSQASGVIVAHGGPCYTLRSYEFSRSSDGPQLKNGSTCTPSTALHLKQVPAAASR